MSDIDRPKTGRARRQTERLLNLLIALRSVSGWLDRDVLRQTIADYRDKDDEAFDRMFNRDKKALRDLGIEISTTDWSDPFTGESAYGYRISDEDYLLPPIDLSPEDISLLAAALDVMRSSAVSGAAVAAVNKLRGQAAPLAGSIDTAAAFDLRAVDSRYAEVMAYVADRRPMRFQYRKPGSAPSRREVVGYCLLTRGEKTYVVGYDLERKAQRAFRLSRIVGRITPLAESLRDAVPDDFAVSPRAVGETAHSGTSTQKAVLRLVPGKGRPLRLRGTKTADGTYEVPFADLQSFAEELLGFGDSVSVVSPQELREAHVELAQATLEALEAVENRGDAHV